MGRLGIWSAAVVVVLATPGASSGQPPIRDLPPDVLLKEFETQRQGGTYAASVNRLAYFLASDSSAKAQTFRRLLAARLPRVTEDLSAYGQLLGGWMAGGDVMIDQEPASFDSLVAIAARDIAQPASHFTVSMIYRLPETVQPRFIPGIVASLRTNPDWSWQRHGDYLAALARIPGGLDAMSCLQDEPHLAQLIERAFEGVQARECRPSN